MQSIGTTSEAARRGPTLCRVVLALLSASAIAPHGAAPAAANCIISDLPDCACDHVGGTWPVTAPPGNLIDVARQTYVTSVTSTRTSCARHRGQAYWQIQMQRRTPDDAHLVAHFFPDYVADFPATAWCTETVAFWHLEAQIPYEYGYGTVANGGARNHHPSPRVTSTRELRLWYKEEERLRVEDGLATRGRWIDGGELDYAGFQPGVNGPCPGAYQQLEGQVYFGPLAVWAGSSDTHSQVVDSMIVYRQGAVTGPVQRIDVRLIEGNVGLDSIPDTLGVMFLRSRVKNSTWYQDIVDFTVLGDSVISGRRKIRGWGIDLDAGGNPNYDASRIRTIVTPLALVYPAPAGADTSDNGTLNLFRVFHSQTQGNIVVTTNSTAVQTGGTIAHSGNHWLIAAAPHPVDPVYIDVDLLANHPLGVRGVEFDWKDGKFPSQFQVWWAAQNGQTLTKTVTKATGAPPPPSGVDFRVSAAFAPDSGYVVRYVRLCFANAVLTEPFEITGMHYVFDAGAPEDSNGASPDAPDEPPPVGVDLAGEPRPHAAVALRLLPSVPNPFRDATTLAFELPHGARGEIRVFDASGRLVRQLPAAAAAAGRSSVAWDGTDDAGRDLPSGTYVYELRADGASVRSRMTLVR
jgi:hypothetical protein